MKSHGSACNEKEQSPPKPAPQRRLSPGLLLVLCSLLMKPLREVFSPLGWGGGAFLWLRVALQVQLSGAPPTALHRMELPSGWWLSIDFQTWFSGSLLPSPSTMACPRRSLWPTWSVWEAPPVAGSLINTHLWLSLSLAGWACNLHGTPIP